VTSILGISAFYHDSAACILKDGKIIEEGNTKKVLEQPQNAYTKTLIEAAPKLPTFQTEL